MVNLFQKDSNTIPSLVICNVSLNSFLEDFYLNFFVFFLAYIAASLWKRMNMLFERLMPACNVQTGVFTNLSQVKRHSSGNRYKFYAQAVATAEKQLYELKL